jgi:hypothetical protein
MTQERGGRLPDSTSPTTEASPPVEAAREEAADVAGTARDAGDHLAQTAADHAREVAAEGKRQVQDVLREGREQLAEQAHAGQQQAAQKISAFGDELVEMAGKTKGHGLGSELARQGAERAHSVGTWLACREPADLLDEVRDFARRRPATFLLGAAVAGAVVGRLTRGAVGRDRRSDGGGRSDGRHLPEDTATAWSAAEADPPAPPVRHDLEPVPVPPAAAPISSQEAADLPPTGPGPVDVPPGADVPPDAPYGGWGPPPPEGFEAYPDEQPDGVPMLREEQTAYGRHGSVER